MKIVITGGGTGGHIWPAVAVGKKLQKEGHEILWIGSRGGMEKEIVQEEGFSFKGILAGKLRRYFSVQNLLDLGKFGWGIWQAKIFLKEFRPQVIFSKGGFVSVPVCIAARMLKIPIVTHESDASPGLATKLIVKMGGNVTICAGFRSIKDWFPKNEVKVTGIPVGEQFWKVKRQEDENKKVTIVGGSQGAVGLNKLIWEGLAKILEKAEVVQLTGKVSLGEAQAVKKVLPEKLSKKFWPIPKVTNEEMAELLGQSDVVISRAGATFLAEAAALGCCVILVPLPKMGSRGDQIDNAEFLVQNKAALELDQGRADGKDLAEMVLGLLADGKKRKEMGRNLKEMSKPEAVKEIVRVILRVGGPHSSMDRAVPS